MHFGNQYWNGLFRDLSWAQDGAPAHRFVQIRDRLNEVFGNNRVIFVSMAFRRVFVSLCFLAHLTYVLHSISVYKKTDGFRKDNRALYFKIKSSLSTVDPDGNGLYWCHSQDRKLRKHFGPGVKFAYSLKFKNNSNRTLHCAGPECGKWRLILTNAR